MRTMIFEECGRTKNKKTKKFVLRTALRPNQIEFSHSLAMASSNKRRFPGCSPAVDSEAAAENRTSARPAGSSSIKLHRFPVRLCGLTRENLGHLRSAGLSKIAHLGVRSG